MSDIESIRVLSPAKLNLHLEVLKKRSDGFHELETVMSAVSIYDSMRFTLGGDFSDQLPILNCRWAAGFPQHDSDGQGLFEALPAAEDNLIFKTVEHMRKIALGDEPLSALSRTLIKTPLRIDVVKQIPAAAGLGGASGNSASTILALNRLWQLNWKKQKLSEVAAELGSDIPFFIYGGTAVCRGRGEQVSPCRLAHRLHAVIVRPPVSLSTPEVFGKLERQFGQRKQVDGLLTALRAGRRHEIAGRMFNRLQFAAGELTDWIGRVQHDFEGMGFVGHQMTGSGSCYFGIASSQTHAMQLAGRLRQRFGGMVYACHTLY